MKTTLTTFQLVLLGGAILILVVAVLIFAGIIPGFRAPSGGIGGTVVWWGTVPQKDLTQLLTEFQSAHQGEFTLVYEERDPRTIEADLVNALATGRGPDLITLPHELLYRQKDKLLAIPYASFSERSFRDTFARAGEIFLAEEGVFGLPFYLDPLVLYYNQDLLINARLAKPPATWSELQEMNSLLTKLDENKQIVQSAVALGQTNNIAHAKDLLALLIIQAGNPIVGGDVAAPEVKLKDSFGLNRVPAAEAVSFFNRFSDPDNLLYAWNGSRPEAREAFVRNELVFYFGYASEAEALHRQNPQLNFDVASVPQRAGTNTTLAKTFALVLPRNSRNPETALLAARFLATGDFAQKLSDLIALPPARKDVLQAGHREALMDGFYKAAIVSRNWLDPTPEKSDDIFREMAETVRSGRLTSEAAVAEANESLALLFK